MQALKREGHSAASKGALSRQAKKQANKKTSSERSEIGKKAAARGWLIKVTPNGAGSQKRRHALGQAADSKEPRTQ